MIADIVKHTSRRARSITWLCEKLIVSEKQLAVRINRAQEEGYNVRVVDGQVWTRTPVGAHDAVCVGSMKPGRHHVPQITDIHVGSRHFDMNALIRTAEEMWDAGGRVAVVTGDVLDGIGPKLIMDQDIVSFDGQAGLAVSIFSKRLPPFKYVAIDGNHDGYHSNAVGMVSGRVLETRMKDAGVDWTFLGVCLGNAVIHGARWELWHPHGGASTSNALRRILNARAESRYSELGPERAPHVLAMGHFHKHVPLAVYPEPVFGVSGGTFQRKGSEFANRISGGWHIGGPIVSYTLGVDGAVSEFSSRFIDADKKAKAA